MPRAGPIQVCRYSLEFKLEAVKLSQLQGVEVQAVADALEIHPFMLSRWRKEARDGVLRGPSVGAARAEGAARARHETVPGLAARPRAPPRGARALRKTHPVQLRTKADVFAFIASQRGTFAVTRLCRLFAVTRPGYYAWRQRPTSPRQVQDRVLLEAMRAIFEASHGTYGSARIHRALTAQGHRVSRRRVERWMRGDGLRGRVARVSRRKAGTHRWFGQHPNQVQRRRATRPNQIWIADITYLAIGGRWWYLAAVLDQYSRRLVAWRLAATRAAHLTRTVVDAALRRRRPAAGLIFHTDRGSEYLGTALRGRLVALAIRQSMTRNHQRLHSALGYRSPVDYEHGAA